MSGAERNHRYRQRNAERLLEKDRAYYEAHREQIVARAARRMAANPEIRRVVSRASARVRYALETGALVKPTACEECGASERRITAAHADYTRPLDVRWLCWPCHRRWDTARPKFIAGQVPDVDGRRRQIALPEE